MKLLLRLIILSTLAAAGVVLYYLQTPIETQTRDFSLEQGSLTRVARQMQGAGVLQHPWIFVQLARIMGKSQSIKAGNYEISAPLTPLQLLAKITEGDYSQSGIKFIEGWTFSQARRALNDNPALRHDSKDLSDLEILQRIGATEHSPEGLFYPDTYYFARGQSDLLVLQRAYKLLKPKLAAAWEKRDANLPFTDPYQGLILASIVEKETGKSSDRAMIAAVFVNRLKIGMRLQTDPSVIYGLGDKFDGNLRRRDLLADQPYNTYTRTGLPPTPIAMPSMESIMAALHPASSSALYFVAKGDGTSQFSSSLEEHNRAVNRYQKK